METSPPTLERQADRRGRRGVGKRICQRPWLALFCACQILLAGCAGSRRADDARLARHPIHDTRASNRPENDYVGTGVWRVRGERNTVYLAGTSHVVADDAIPFPSSFYAAYGDSRAVCVEFDTNLSWWGKIRLVPRLWKWVKAHRDELVTPRGRTLADYLSLATLEDLRHRYGKDFSRERVTPTFLLCQNEAGMLDAKAGEKPSGVEEPFEILARRDGKPLLQLDDDSVIETALLVMDQSLLSIQRDIAKRGADAVVREALLTNQRDDDSIWRRGDLGAAERLQEEMKRESPILYEKALRDRNRNWMGKLAKILRSDRNTLVLVGAAHLPGEDGLLHLLREAGYAAEQMYGVDRPETAPNR